ncbi:hypothetical protein EW146_g257 [Bondarzewia mesenterica]|uniref:AB hydrolase-1 domain-containing protein n=1 Tax=Bondarzewia mesenterica TaxID=1095465 RepID=A0A4S4M7I7_9AGAM|nr:hypothetical protein EW146_g257 [Bondarzewia mesenterica]
MPSDTLVVTKSGVQLSYIDSGAPSKSPYITIIAIHGMCFAGRRSSSLAIFSIAFSRGIRFVTVNRRNFPGATPFTSDEVNIIATGTDQQKSAWMQARGQEVANFIDAFIQKYDIPAISDDGKSGGIALLGWSVGAPFACAAIASVDTLPPDARARLGSRIRTLIAHEPAPMAFGLPTPEKNWAPVSDTSIPAELRLKVFAQWVSSYFDHGDLSKRDLDLLSYILPSTSHPPTIFNMSAAEIKDTVTDGEAASVDLPFLFYLQPQHKVNYRKAFFDPATAKLFPKMKISFLAGDQSPAWGLAGLWAVQDEAKELGNGRIHFKLIPGVNHFVHWDYPEKTVDIYVECLNA